PQRGDDQLRQLLRPALQLRGPGRVAPATRHARDSVQLRRLTPLADELVLTLWTSDPQLAARADAAGVERIGVDLERLGKRDRQGGLGTWISEHTEADLATVGTALAGA